MSVRSSSPASPVLSSHQGSPPTGELRHLTSNSGLGSNRNSQMLQPGSSRYGSKSPTETPSSPTSIHSSSSAIFERDIEPLASSPSATAHASHVTNPHFIARARATEQLEQSVPSVLDSATEVLTAMQPSDHEAAEHIAVVSPVHDRGSTSGFTSPIGSFRSRSPSPSLSPMAANYNRGSLLLSPPLAHSQGSQPSVATPTGAAPSRPAVNTSISPVQSPTKPPSINTPTSAYFSTASSADDESPLTTTVEQHPVFPASFSPTGTSSHPPSPSHVAKKRLSFMSYKDLLTSTPTSTQLLSALTTSASSVDPPPHIPGLNGFSQATSPSSVGSDGPSLRGFEVKEVDSTVDDIGGEWQREGLGRGLEERLEALMPVGGKA